jgi:N-acyl-D-amino-acid deacylase
MFDILIRNGRIYDGAGSAWYLADIGVRGDKIEAIGRFPGAAGRHEIDAAGKIVCPGFIDVHTHSELALLDGSEAGAAVLQGVTTQVIAADGMSYAPLPRQRLLELRDLLGGVYGKPDIGWDFATVGEYLAKFAGRLPHNVVYQVPHQAIRLAVLGWEDRQATPAEMDQMKALTRQAMDDGAAPAFATILDTAPCCWADTAELIELCKVVRERGGIFAPHIRYPIGHFPAIAEALEVAENAGVPVHIAHHYSDEDILTPVEQARQRGIDVTVDAYPYWAGSTTLLACTPLWMRRGSPADVRARLAEPAARAQLRAEGLDTPHLRQYQLGAVGPARNQYLEGQTIGQAAEASGKEFADWMCDLLLDADLCVTIISLSDAAKEEWMLKTLTHPAHMVMTDGIFTGSRPHPRGFNTYPRVMGHYVRERGILTYETAIRKCAGFPAQRYNLHDRGLLKRGLAADIVVFDPQTISDKGWFDSGRRPPVGIEYVIVNGKLAVEAGRRNAAFPGVVLKPAA